MSTEKEIRPPEEDGREKQEISGSVLEAKRAIETIGAGALEEAARAIRSLEERAVNRELSPGNGFDGLTASKRGEILKKIVDKSIVFAQRLIKISALVALGLTANYFRTKESVSESSGTNNEIVYAHGDEETTHILNYLAGRETLAEEEQPMFTACQGCGFPRNVGGQKRRGSVPFIICDRCTQRVRHGKCCLCDNPPAEGSFRCESCSDVDRSVDTAVRAEWAYMEQLLAYARARLTPHFARPRRFKHRRA